MRGSVDDRDAGTGIMPGRRRVPARLLMPTSPARITLSPGARQIKTHMTTGITQTRLVMAGERRAVTRIRSRRAGRRFRCRMPERP